MLESVQDKQQLATRDRALKSFQAGFGRGAKRLGDGRNDLCRAFQSRQVDEHRAVCQLVGGPRGRSQSQARLANSGWSGQRQEDCTRPQQIATEPLDLRVATDQRRRHGRQAIRLAGATLIGISSSPGTVEAHQAGRTDRGQPQQQLGVIRSEPLARGEADNRERAYELVLMN